MKTLLELENPDVRAAFFREAVEHTRRSAGVSTTSANFGANTGVLGRGGEDAFNVDAWFDNADWDKCK